MSTWIWILLFVLIIFPFVIAPVLIVPPIIYVSTLVRTRKKKWTRKCSTRSDQEIIDMYYIGLDWAEKYEDKKREVDIYSGKYHLFGEYFDFGSDRAIILIAGRTETLLYSYYYAEPYRCAGCNVLVIDGRAHGKSDGVLNRLGYDEYKDIIAWSRFLHDELHNAKVFLHGICIGASNALFALTADDCPEYVAGMISDGMFVRFYETLYRRIKALHQPIYPAIWEMWGYIKLFTGYDIKNDGPVFRIGKLKKPILMLQSKEDIFSLPEKAKELYAQCSAPKRLVYFDKGRHSHVRINNTEKFDEAIIEFFEELCNNNTIVNSIINE